MHEHLLLWPTVANQTRKSLVQVFPDWPSHSFKEMNFIKRKLEWKSLKVLCRVTCTGNAKPDFVMYFDAEER